MRYRIAAVIFSFLLYPLSQYCQVLPSDVESLSQKIDKDFYNLSEGIKTNTVRKEQEFFERNLFNILDQKHGHESYQRLKRIYGILGKSDMVAKDTEFVIVEPNRLTWKQFQGQAAAMGKMLDEDKAFGIQALGAKVYVRESFLKDTDDNSLMLILAHELGHNRWDFVRKLLISNSSVSGNLKKAINIRLEEQADEMGLYILYDVRKTPPNDYVVLLNERHETQRAKAASVVLTKIKEYNTQYVASRPSQ